MARDVNIGKPNPATLNDVVEKLSDLESKIVDLSDRLDNTNSELTKISFGTGVIIDDEIEVE